MSMLRSAVRGAAGAGLGIVAVMGCAGMDEDEHTGVAQIAITEVPSDGSVGCIAVTATGSTTVTRKTDVSPGASTVLQLQGLPTGTVSFVGNAYAGACAKVSPSAVPTWLSDPVLATVSSVPVTVALVLKRNGQATVGIDFDDSSTCRAIGAPCLSGAECCSNICAGNACQASCQAEGAACATDADCCSGPCAGGVCGCPAGLASCGGACIDVASDPMNCGACNSICPPGSVCAAGACLWLPPSCSDGIWNGMESDIDCGGPCTTKCAVGQSCIVGADCESSVCIGGVCAPPTCSDGVKNGAETDVDCGGSCVPCMTGKACNMGGDCESGVCTGGMCQPPSCSDGVKNGMESDIDCGGWSCLPCLPGQACLLPSDCLTGICVNGACQ